MTSQDDFNTLITEVVRFRDSDGKEHKTLALARVAEAKIRLHQMLLGLGRSPSFRETDEDDVFEWLITNWQAVSAILEVIHRLQTEAEAS